MAGRSANGVEGIAVKRPAATVTDADVDAMVNNLREQRPRFTAVSASKSSRSK